MGRRCGATPEHRGENGCFFIIVDFCLSFTDFVLMSLCYFCLYPCPLQCLFNISCNDTAFLNVSSSGFASNLIIVEIEFMSSRAFSKLYSSLVDLGRFRNDSP